MSSTRIDSIHPTLDSEARAEILDDLADRLGIGLVVCDADDRVVWTNRRIVEDFAGAISEGAEFSSTLDQLTLLPPELNTDSSDESSTSRIRHIVARPGGELSYQRHLEFPLDGGQGLRAHCLADANFERQLQQQLRTNLGQLASMREIIDTLYESLSTREVLYLILIALTADLGFGFNRAFYLQAQGDRLRGKMGIGPSDSEQARRIWQRIDDLNLSTLRGLYQNMTENGETPDPETNGTALQLEFRIGEDTDSELLDAIRDCRPALLRAANCEHRRDRELFDVLGTDAIAIVPLHVQDELVGVLIADNFVTRTPLSETDLSVLKAFSRYAGVALERSSLYDKLSSNVEKLQKANQELKAQQERMIRVEKLSALGKLATEVTHEIRNPMAIIGGHARSMLACSEHSEEDRESLELIVSEVARLERYLTETLDFGRSDEVQMKVMDLRCSISGCLASLNRELDERSIALELELPARELRCRIDADCFHRALANLLKNSIEAIGECGTIRVCARATEHTAHIELSDSGGGIPEELHARVFEPFFTTKPEGTGLGMAIAAQNIRELSGDISLQADERFTSIFIIEIPLEQERVREL